MSESIVLRPGTGLTVDGLASIQYLKIEGVPTLESVGFPALKSAEDLVINGNPLLKNIEFPALVSYIAPLGFRLTIQSNPELTGVNLNSLLFSARTMDISGNAALTYIQLGSLVSIPEELKISSNPMLAALSLPALISVGSRSAFFGFNASDCTALANVSLPKYLPVNGRQQWFKNCALTQASVDHILARCVASCGYVSGDVDLSGGTNAPPSAVGATDKATLIARGCTVITN